jgi:ATPase subunit of ABC transporter with duplicated ATPase domains
LDKFLFDRDAVHRPVRLLSYGERTKLALAMLVGAGATLLLLDEPTSHLDPLSQERIEGALASYAGPIIVVSHDRAFLRAIGISRALIIAGKRVREAGDLASAEAALAEMDDLDRMRSIL